MKRDFIILGIVALAVGILMRIFYPMPFVYSDSAAYINSAVYGTFNVFRPMGYSHYLAMLHSIVPTLGFIFYVTYILYIVSTLTLTWVAVKTLDIKRHSIILAMGLCSILSARIIFSCNYLMSDALFVILSSLYLTTIMLMFGKKPWIWLIVNLILLWLMCKVRYSGLFFIPVSIVAFYVSLSSFKTPARIAAACIPLILAFCFYNSEKKSFKENIGIEAFSGFGGWQSINNASVLFPEAKQIPLSYFKDKDLQNLHKYMCTCPDGVFNDDYTMGTTYMWDNSLPYKQFTFAMCQYKGTPYAYQWVANGDLFGRYATQLIKRYPFQYIKKYFFPALWSNVKFMGFGEENMILQNEAMYSEGYGLTEPEYSQKHHFFTSIDPARKVVQAIYWICAVIGTAAFIFLACRRKITGQRFSVLLCIILAIVIIIGGQSVSSPNTTWRYTMPFYIPSIIFLFTVLDSLLREMPELGRA